MATEKELVDDIRDVGKQLESPPADVDDLLTLLDVRPPVKTILFIRFKIGCLVVFYPSCSVLRTWSDFVYNLWLYLLVFWMTVRLHIFILYLNTNFNCILRRVFSMTFSSFFFCDFCWHLWKNFLNNLIVALDLLVKWTSMFLCHSVRKYSLSVVLYGKFFIFHKWFGVSWDLN